uniref:Zinc finger B-box domain-containing protein 1 n=1 Tax=Leptobrachium leishanense TaxID=445787 RepID=A0A8C5PIA5_9ANUR
MSSDFSVFPATKGGNSVKLKAKNVRELRVENIQLEIQNQEMEDKLNQLRLVMTKEKEERERSNGFFWKSGQVGNPSQTPDKENIGKISSGRIKFKVLKNPLPEPMKLSTVTKSANTVIPIEKTKIKGKACGQCEMKSALLICLECGEDYCPACFAKIHQKGALKLHRSMAIQGKSQDGKLDVLREPKIRLNCEEPSETLVSEKDDSGHVVSSGAHSSVSVQNAKEQAFYSAPGRHTPGLLLHGTFNEDESAKSFSEALTEWRNQSCNTREKQPVLEVDTDYTGNSAAQTTLTVQRKPFEVEFTENGINYMEKLILKKHRRTPVNYVARASLDKLRYSSTSVSERDLNDYDGLTADEIEDHEHYIALFKPQMHISDQVMNEPALQIVELDKVPEEDLEETRACSVTEVKHNNVINSQQRFPATDYPKTTPVCDPLSDYTPSGTTLSDLASSVHALTSDSSPVQAMKKKQNNLLGCTYSIGSNYIFTGDVNVKLTKASLLEDSKSMKYKTSNDNHSLDSASIVNLATEFETIARTERNISLEYHGLNGFFTMGVDSEEMKDELQPPTAYKQSEDVGKIISIGGYSRRPYSARSTSQSSEYHNNSRPSTATSRPISRAAGEISEIEYIDKTDHDDPHSEYVEEQETLTVLGRELDLIRHNSGKKETKQPGACQEQFKISRHGKRLTETVEKTQTESQHAKTSSPGHSMKFLRSRDGENDSYEDDEDLQDRLHVLLLQ